MSMPAMFLRSRLALCAGLALVLPPAMGQGSAPQANPPTTGSGTANEAAVQRVTITATADRGLAAKDVEAGVLGDLPLLETPYSVNVLTRALLDKQQAAHYGDFLKNDPSVTFGNVPVGFTTLRGFSVGPAGYLYDGLPGNAGLSDGRGQIEAIERIDILKGPSAFLNGLGASTSLGGTFNFVPKRPVDAPVRVLSAGYTSQSLLSALADLGDRFGDQRQFGARVNLGLRDGEQAVDGADWRHVAASVALDWRVSPDLLFTAIAETADNRFPRLQPFFAVAPGIEVPDAPKASRSLAQPWDDFRTRYDNVYLRGDWAFAPNWSASAQLLFNQGRRDRTKEARFGFIDDAAGNVTQFSSESESESEATTGQVLVRGRFATGAVEHQMTLGASAGTEESSFGSAFLTTIATNLYNPVAAPEPAGATPQPGGAQKSHTSSLLVSDVLRFDSRWSVLLGARSARLKIDDNEVRKTSPTAALMFKPTPASLLYLNYAEGVEPGGTAPAGSSNEDTRMPPIVTEQFELGGRLDLGGLMLTAALFDLKKPFEYVDGIGGPFVQNGEQRHKGLEIGAAGQINNQWSLLAGAMWLDPKTNRTGDPATEGKRPIGVSQFNANAFAEYRFEDVPGLYLNAGVYYIGAQYVDTTNTQRIPSSTRVDLGARYETRVASTATAFLLTVENVADKSYWAGAQSGFLTLGEPLTVKASARFSF